VGSSHVGSLVTFYRLQRDARRPPYLVRDSSRLFCNFTVRGGALKGSRGETNMHP